MQYVWCGDQECNGYSSAAVVACARVAGHGGEVGVRAAAGGLAVVH